MFLRGMAEKKIFKKEKEGRKKSLKMSRVT